MQRYGKIWKSQIDLAPSGERGKEAGEGRMNIVMVVYLLILRIPRGMSSFRLVQQLFWRHDSISPGKRDSRSDFASGPISRACGDRRHESPAWPSTRSRRTRALTLDS